MEVIQERHFLPVKEEEEEVGDKIHEELEVKDEIAPESSNADEEVEIKGSHPGPVLPGKVNGCHGAFEPERVCVSTSKQTSTIINRTARPFLSPLTVQSPEAGCPVMDIPPPPSYDTPPLPAFTAPQLLAFSPPPPPPSYPTPPLPAFTNQPPQTYCSSPPPVSPVMSPSSPPPSEFPASILSQYPPMPNYGPPAAQSAAEKRTTTPIKTGVLEESAAKRATKKSMFTFKEKPVVSPNPDLLLLVQGVDERKKHGHKSVPEPACEEELLALGAEASNFLAKEEAKVEDAKAPEWVSCLKSSRTQPRPEHRPEQTLINVSGKGAELFAKRQSRMEKYVVENQGGQMRSPSPTMSLPPSWVYPSTMPGRVKAIVKNSDVSAQLSQNLQAQQAAKQRPRQKTKAPEPAPEPPPVENGCSKIEMDLSSHRPYQIDSNLFIIKPVMDPISTLPRGAPHSRNLLTQAFSRQASLPNSSTLNFRTQCTSPQLPLSPARGRGETVSHPGSGAPRSSSAMSAFSPERVSSPRSGVQAPRPTFSAKKSGIVPQTPKDSGPSVSETPAQTRTSGLSKCFSSPEGATAAWTPGHRPSTSISSCPAAPRMSSPGGPRCLSPEVTQTVHFSPVTSTTTSASPRTFAAASPRSPPWGSRCQSPMMTQNTRSSSVSPVPGFRPSQTSKTAPFSPPWGSRCHSPTNQSPATFKPFQTSTTTSPCSPPWGSRCQSPMPSQNASPVISVSTSRPTQTSTSPASPPWSLRSQSPGLSQTRLSFPATKPVHTSSVASPIHTPRDSCCVSPVINSLDSKANHRLLAKNIINAAKRKNSPSPGALSGHSLPISPVGKPSYDCHQQPISPFQSRALGAQSPTFTSPPTTPTQRICSPVRLYNSRSLTDSDASVESEDSGHRSPGLQSYNTCPRGWGGSLRVKRSTVSTDL
ncbi:synaptopodin isoform X2 [Takifugu flavidus]|nr:synaptopodin isoform X2 [Takifugu flavidus]